MTVVKDKSSKVGTLHLGREFRVLAALTVFLAGIQILTIAFSLGRIVISRGWAVFIIFISLLIALWYGWFLRPGCSRRAPGSSRPKRPLPGLFRAMIIFALFFYFLLWITAYALPDIGFDGLWYHNPTMHFWSARGYVHWIKCDVPVWENRINHGFNGWPKGVELLGFIAMRASGLPRFLNALNLPLLALGIYAIFCLARMWGAPAGLSLLAGVLFTFVPVNIALSFTTLVDPGVAAFYIALMALTAFTVNLIREGTVPWKFSPGLGCALGLAIAAKGPGLILFPLVIAILFLAFVLPHCLPGQRRFGPGDTTDSLIFYSPATLSRGLLFILIVALTAAVTGGYWSLRNFFITGSPIYPIGLKLGGWTIFPGEVLDSYLRKPFIPGTGEWSQLKRILFSWLDNLGDWRVAITRNDHPSGGLGLLWIVGGLPALVILSIRIAGDTIIGRDSPQWKFGRYSFLSVLVMTLVLFFFMPSGHNHKARYVIWLYGPGLASMALVAGWIRAAGPKTIRWGGTIWLVGALLLFLFQGLYCFHYQLNLLCSYERKSDQKAGCLFRALSSLGRPYPTGYFWKDLPGSIFDYILNDQRPVALGPLRVMAQPILGHLTQDKNFGKRQILFLDLALADDSVRLRKFIREHSIYYIILDEEMPLSTNLRKMALLNEKAGKYFRVLVINPEPIVEQGIQKPREDTFP